MAPDAGGRVFQATALYIWARVAALVLCAVRGPVWQRLVFSPVWLAQHQDDVASTKMLKYLLIVDAVELHAYATMLWAASGVAHRRDVARNHACNALGLFLLFLWDFFYMLRGACTPLGSLVSLSLDLLLAAFSVETRRVALEDAGGDAAEASAFSRLLSVAGWLSAGYGVFIFAIVAPPLRWVAQHVHSPAWQLEHRAGPMSTSVLTYLWAYMGFILLVHGPLLISLSRTRRLQDRDGILFAYISTMLCFFAFDSATSAVGALQHVAAITSVAADAGFLVLAVVIWWRLGSGEIKASASLVKPHGD